MNSVWKDVALTELTRDGRRAAWAERAPLVCLIALSVFLSVWTYQTVGKADAWAEVQTYSRVDYWIKSSECTAQTKVPLAICEPNGISGIEDHSLADDRGHTLIGNLYALLTGRAIDRKVLTRTNIILNAGSLLALAFALYHYGWRLAAILLLAFGISKVIPGPHPGPDATAAYIAAFNLSMVSILWTVHVPLGGRKRSRRRFVLGLIVATVSLALATLIRQPYGVGALLVAILVLIGRISYAAWIHETRLNGALYARTTVCVFFLSIAALYSTNILVAARSAVYEVPRGTAMLNHGIGHNLYIGLGIKGNPWGIEWSDEYGYKAANTVNPVRYASADHFRNLWWLYVRTISSSPGAAINVYMTKLRESLQLVVKNSMGWTLLALLLPLVVYRRYVEPRWLSTAFAVWLGFGMVILQGVLALPSSSFISPGTLGFLCGLAILAEMAIRVVLDRLLRFRSLAITPRDARS
jgi:hypothetical protein